MPRRSASVTQAGLSRRIRARELADALGLSVRAIQVMAKRGDLPGAAQIGGRMWTFDSDKIQEYQKREKLRIENPEKYERLYGDEEDPLKKGRERIHKSDEPSRRVYVVGYGAYVKIGFSESRRGARIKALQTGSPEKIAVYAFLPGTRKMELALHKKFAAYRLRGEWFKKRGALARWLANGCPVPKGMEDLQWRRL